MSKLQQRSDALTESVCPINNSSSLFQQNLKDSIGIEVPAFLAELPEALAVQWLSPTIKPSPLPSGLPPTQPFSDDLLPRPLREFVRDIADRQQCPPDFVAITLIVAVSAIIGRKFSIKPKQRDSWEVIPNQWGVIVGRPSAMKSPAMKAALAPLASLEAKERAKHEEALTEHKARSELLEMQRKAAKNNAQKKVTEGNESAAVELLSRFSNDIPRPVRRRYVVNDATVEKLGELLNQNPNGLLLARDELAGWIALIQSEEGAGDRAFYLECFDGNGSFVYDRIGRGTVDIRSCCLSLIGGIQPSKIAPLVRSAVNGVGDDGLVQRLQLCVWPDDIETWEWRDRHPNITAQERVETVLAELDSLPDKPRQTLHFTIDAQELFKEWMIEHQNQIRNDDLHPALAAHLTKMPQTIAGLALLFELVQGGREAVGVEAIARALDWADYLKSHAGRLYGAAINAPLMGARLIYDRKNKLPHPFAPREIRQKGWAGLDSIDAINEALAILAEHNLVIPYQVTFEKGGRPSFRFVWQRGV